MIQESVIEAIKGLDIVRVVSDYVTLKKRGASYVACCPLHDEKTPSFYVSEAKQIFKCYGCGAGGDAISFVMKKESLSFLEAVEVLCERHGIEFEMDAEQEQAHKQKSRQYLIMKWAEEFYVSLFDGSIAQQYATDRGFSAEISKQFAMGYTPKVLYGLSAYLQDKGVSIEEMMELSLCKKGGYDFFRKRITFPIHDYMGKTIGFSSRALDDKTKPKYINSTDTPLYSKSAVLYGLDKAKSAISKKGVAIVVEGAPDVISMHQFGHQHTVGTLGTSLTEAHAKLLRKYTRNVVMMYDGDNAGLKAVFRSAGVLFSQGLFVKVCRLPDGHDPDTFVRQFDSDYVNNHIESNSKDFVEFRLSLLEDLSDKVVVAKELKAMIKTFPDAEAREIMLYDYSQKLGLGGRKPVVKSKVKPKKDVDVELQICRIALTYGYDVIAEHISEVDLDFFENESYKALLSHILKEKVSSLYDIRKSEDNALFESAQGCMDVLIGYSSPDIDIDYTIVKYMLVMLERLERRVKLGMGGYDYNQSVAILGNIKQGRLEYNEALKQIITDSKKQAV